mmetsp:Transcript_3800/g.9177  ORF Transcript_3800/g.9177 Transcript_3800/m.9177 type:complete len:362 (+) Transcript_3800:153-1238(+)
MHPAQQINHISCQIAGGNYDQAIESLTSTLKVLQFAISGDAKITMMCPEESDDEESSSLNETSSVPQREHHKNNINNNNSNSNNRLRYDFFSCCSPESASSSLWLEGTSSDTSVVPHKTGSTLASASASTNSSQPWRRSSTGSGTGSSSSSSTSNRPCHEENSASPGNQHDCGSHHKCNACACSSSRQSALTDDANSPLISVFGDPIVVQGGDRPPVHLDVETCEDLSYAVIYNLAVAHHLKSEEVTGSLRTIYLHKALSLYEYSHQLIRKQHLTLVPAVHSMALANNVGHIHQALGHPDKTELCMQHILSIVVYLIDRGEFVVGNPERTEPIEPNNASSIERFFHTALRLMAKDSPAASA